MNNQRERGRLLARLCACAAVILLASALLGGAPLAQAQVATPAAEPEPVSLEEAKAMVAGYSAAFNAGDLDGAAAYIADDFAFESWWEGGLGEKIVGKERWLRSMAEGLEGGCLSLQEVVGVEGNVAHVIESWTCVTPDSAVTSLLLSLELTIEDGQYAALHEFVLEPSTDLYIEQLDRETEVSVLFARLNKGKMDEVADRLADDVTLTVTFDPVLGKGQTVEGKAAVLEVLQAWVDAEVIYSSTPWGHQASRTLGHGRLSWPAWTELMGVGLYTEDVVGYKEGLVNLIQIGPKPEMTRVYKERLEAAQ